jgi:hypothetical protein
VAIKLAMMLRKRGVILAAVSMGSALVAAKTGGHGGIQDFGYWDGPS